MSHNVVPSRYWGGEQGEFRPVWRTEATDRDKVCVCISKSSRGNSKKRRDCNWPFLCSSMTSLVLDAITVILGKKSGGKKVKIDTAPRLHTDMSINMKIWNLFFPLRSQPGLELQQPCSASHDRIKFMNVFRVSHTRTHKKWDCNFTFWPSSIGLPYSRFKSQNQKLMDWLIERGGYLVCSTLH